MSQQHPQPQQQRQPQQQSQQFQSAYETGGQVGGGIGQWQERREGRQETRQEIRGTVLTLHRFETALELARIRAIENRRPRVARLCGDLAAITEAEKKLVLRRSPFAQPIGEAVKETIQQGVQELRRAAEIPEVQEALSEAQQSTTAVDRAHSLVEASQAAGAAGFEPMYGTARQIGGGLGQHQQVQQFRQDVRETAMALHRFETALQVARMKALENGRLWVARTCADLAIVADLEKKLVLRRSPFAEPIGEAVEETIQQGIQHLQQAADDPEVQQALSAAQPAIDAVRTAVAERMGQMEQGQQGQIGPGLQGQTSHGQQGRMGQGQIGQGLQGQMEQGQQGGSQPVQQY